MNGTRRLLVGLFLVLVVTVGASRVLHLSSVVSPFFIYRAEIGQKTSGS